MTVTRFDFLMPESTAFGWGRRIEVGQRARGLGNRVFFLLGSRTLAGNGTSAEFLTFLRASGLDVIELGIVTQEPEVEDIDNLVRKILPYRPSAGDVIVVAGGGSAMDTAKALAGLATQKLQCSVVEYLEGVGTGKRVQEPPLPVLAIPTTAGTGSEATKNAVISSRWPPFKKSFRDERLVPSCVIVDPELTVSNPPKVTAESGMDAITQLIESYLSRKAQPIPSSLVESALPGLLNALRTAFHEPENQVARERMAYAAYVSGVALANSGLGMAHGVAAALGCLLGTGHGLACASLLPIALQVNSTIKSIETIRLAELLLGNVYMDSESAAAALIAEIRELQRELAIPRRLRWLGVSEDSLAEIAEHSQGSSMGGNPRQLTKADLVEILRENL